MCLTAMERSMRILSTNWAAKICEQHVHDCVFEKTTFMRGW